jgi:hypothetical protein
LANLETKTLFSNSSYINEDLQTNKRFDVFSDSDTTSDNEDSEAYGDTPDYCNEPTIEITYNNQKSL